MGTRMGEIAHLLKTAEKGASPLQDKLHRLGKLLGFFSLAISILVFIIGTAAGRTCIWIPDVCRYSTWSTELTGCLVWRSERGEDPSEDNPHWLQMLLVAVSLTVAAVPVLVSTLHLDVLIIN